MGGRGRSSTVFVFMDQEPRDVGRHSKLIPDAWAHFLGKMNGILFQPLCTTARRTTCFLVNSLQSVNPTMQWALLPFLFKCSEKGYPYSNLSTGGPRICNSNLEKGFPYIILTSQVGRTWCPFSAPGKSPNPRPRRPKRSRAGERGRSAFGEARGAGGAGDQPGDCQEVLLPGEKPGDVGGRKKYQKMAPGCPVVPSFACFFF